MLQLCGKLLLFLQHKLTGVNAALEEGKRERMKREKKEGGDDTDFPSRWKQVRIPSAR